MNGDIDGAQVRHIASGAERKGDVLEIVALTTLDLDGLDDGLSVRDTHRDGRDTHRVAIHVQLQPVGVAAGCHIEIERNGGLRAQTDVGRLLVGQRDIEYRPLVGRHIADLALVDRDMRILDGYGRVAQRCSRDVEQRAVAALVGATAGTCEALENEAAVLVVGCRHHGIAIGILIIGVDGVRDTIDIDIHIAERVRRERIGIGTRVGLVVFACGTTEIQIRNRLDLETELSRRRYGLQLGHILLLIFDGGNRQNLLDDVARSHLAEYTENTLRRDRNGSVRVVLVVGKLVALGVGNRRCARHGIGLVGLVAVEGQHLFLLVDVDELNPLANHAVVFGNRIARTLHVGAFGVHPSVVLGAIAVHVRIQRGVIDALTGGVCLLLRRGGVGGQQQVVPLADQRRDDRTDDILLRIGEVRSVRERVHQLAAHYQIAHLAVGVAARSYQLHRSVGHLALHGGVSHRVEHAHTVSDTVINHLRRSDIDIGVRSHVVGIATRMHALGGGVFGRGSPLSRALVGHRNGELRSVLYYHLLSGKDTLSYRRIDRSDQARIVRAVGDGEVKSGGPRQVPRVGRGISRSRCQRGVAARSGRVAQDVVELDARIGLAHALHAVQSVGKHIDLERVGGDMLAVMLDGHLQAACDSVVQPRVGRIIRLQRGVPHTVVVEYAAQRLRLGVHAVVDIHFVAVQHHLVACRRGVAAVVVVVLVRRDAEGVFALGEYRLAEQILVFAVFVFIDQILCPCHAVEDGHVGALVAEIALLHAVNHLRERDADIAVIGVAERVVAEHHFLVVEQRIDKEAVGQVERLHGRALVRQRGVALGVQLRNLIFDGEQIDKELARRFVGINQNLLLLEYHARVLLVRGVGGVQNGGVQLVDGGVLRVVNQQRRVVALQLEHHGQAVAQVVAAQAEAERQLALVVAADDTAQEAYLGLIVHPQAVHVLRGLEQAVALDDEESVVSECVLIHDGLNGDGCLRNVEAKITRRVGHDTVAVSVFHGHPIHQELHIAHRNGRVAEQHAACEAHRFGIDKVDAVHLGTRGVERDGGDAVGVAVIGEFSVLGGRRDGEGGAAVERNAAEAVGTVLVAYGAIRQHGVIGAPHTVNRGLIDVEQQVGPIGLTDVLHGHVADISTDSGRADVALRAVEGVIVGQQIFLARQVGVRGVGDLFGRERAPPNPHLVEIHVGSLAEQIEVALVYMHGLYRLLADGFAVLVERNGVRARVADHGNGGPYVFLERDGGFYLLRAVQELQFLVVVDQVESDVIRIARQWSARGE